MRFLFALFIAGLQAVIRLIFVALVVLLIAAAALNGRRAQMSDTTGVESTASTNSPASDSHLNASGEISDGQ